MTDASLFDSKKLVINIQDLHCNPEVQRNISAVLSVLDKKFGLKNVYVEGGYGDVSTSWLCDIRDRSAKKQIIENLLEKGILTGSEAYSVLSDRPSLLKGLEDEKIHKANIIRLGHILEMRGYFEKKAGVLSNELESMENEFFSERNKHFNKLIEDHKKGNISSEKYYELLSKYVAKINEDTSKFNNLLPVRMENYPNICSYLELSRISKSLKYDRISRQMEEVIKEIKTRLPYAEYKELLDKTNNFSNTDALYLLLPKISKAFGIGLENRYIDLNKFFEYVENTKKLNPINLINEEKRLVEDIRIGFSNDVNELDVSFLADFFGYFKDYLFNTLSADDYSYFVARFDNFQKVWSKYSRNSTLKDIIKEFRLLNEFYKTNCLRNECFLSKLPLDPASPGLHREEGKNRSETDQETIVKSIKNSEVLVVITGGFHTSGLKESLARRGISYITITPNITKDSRHSNLVYTELAREQAKRFSSQALALALGSTDAKVVSIDDIRIIVHIGGDVGGTDITILRKEGNKVEFQKDFESIEIAGKTFNKEALEEVVKNAMAGVQNFQKFTNPLASSELVYNLVKLFSMWGSRDDFFGYNGIIWKIASDPNVQKAINEQEGVSNDELSRLPDILQEIIKDHLAGRAELECKNPVINAVIQNPLMKDFVNQAFIKPIKELPDVIEAFENPEKWEAFLFDHLRVMKKATFEFAMELIRKAADATKIVIEQHYGNAAYEEVVRIVIDIFKDIPGGLGVRESSLRAYSKELLAVIPLELQTPLNFAYIISHGFWNFMNQLTPLSSQENTLLAEKKQDLDAGVKKISDEERLQIEEQVKRFRADLRIALQFNIDVPGKGPAEEQKIIDQFFDALSSVYANNLLLNFTHTSGQINLVKGMKERISEFINSQKLNFSETIKAQFGGKISESDIILELAQRVIQKPMYPLVKEINKRLTYVRYVGQANYVSYVDKLGGVPVFTPFIVEEVQIDNEAEKRWLLIPQGEFSALLLTKAVLTADEKRYYVPHAIAVIDPRTREMCQNVNRINGALLQIPENGEACYGANTFVIIDSRNLQKGQKAPAREIGFLEMKMILNDLGEDLAGEENAEMTFGEEVAKYFKEASPEPRQLPAFLMNSTKSIISKVRTDMKRGERYTPRIHDIKLMAKSNNSYKFQYENDELTKRLTLEKYRMSYNKKHSENPLPKNWLEELKRLNAWYAGLKDNERGQLEPLMMKQKELLLAIENTKPKDIDEAIEEFEAFAATQTGISNTLLEKFKRLTILQLHKRNCEVNFAPSYKDEVDESITNPVQFLLDHFAPGDFNELYDSVKDLLAKIFGWAKAGKVYPNTIEEIVPYMAESIEGIASLSIFESLTYRVLGVIQMIEGERWAREAVIAGNPNATEEELYAAGKAGNIKAHRKFNVENPLTPLARTSNPAAPIELTDTAAITEILDSSMHTPDSGGQECWNIMQLEEALGNRRYIQAIENADLTNRLYAQIEARLRFNGGNRKTTEEDFGFKTYSLEHNKEIKKFMDNVILEMFAEYLLDGGNRVPAGDDWHWDFTGLSPFVRLGRSNFRDMFEKLDSLYPSWSSDERAAGKTIFVAEPFGRPFSEHTFSQEFKRQLRIQARAKRFIVYDTAKALGLTAAYVGFYKDEIELYTAEVAADYLLAQTGPRDPPFRGDFCWTFKGLSKLIDFTALQKVNILFTDIPKLIDRNYRTLQLLYPGEYPPDPFGIEFDQHNFTAEYYEQIDARTGFNKGVFDRNSSDFGFDTGFEYNPEIMSFMHKINLKILAKYLLDERNRVNVGSDWHWDFTNLPQVLDTRNIGIEHMLKELDANYESIAQEERDSGNLSYVEPPFWFPAAGKGFLFEFKRQYHVLQHIHNDSAGQVVNDLGLNYYIITNQSRQDVPVGNYYDEEVVPLETYKKYAETYPDRVTYDAAFPDWWKNPSNVDEKRRCESEFSPEAEAPGLLKLVIWVWNFVSTRGIEFLDDAIKDASIVFVVGQHEFIGRKEQKTRLSGTMEMMKALYAAIDTLSQTLGLTAFGIENITREIFDLAVSMHEDYSKAHPEAPLTEVAVAPAENVKPAIAALPSNSVTKGKPKPRKEGIDLSDPKFQG